MNESTMHKQRNIRQRYRPSFYLGMAKIGFNGMLHWMARVLPGGLTLRPFLHRLRGVKISGEVYIGDDVYLDDDHPECIEINDGAVIAARCTIIGHTRGAGRVIIGKNAAIAAGCVIVCGPGKTLTIGEGAVISAGSTVLHDIPPCTLCGAPRIKEYGRVRVPFTIGTSYEEFRRGVEPIRPKGAEVIAESKGR